MNNKQKNIKGCEICEESNATCLCYTCLQYFCDSCFKYIHDIKKKSKHKKEILDPFVPIDLKCPEHPTIHLNLFCLDEKGKTYINKNNFSFFDNN